MLLSSSQHLETIENVSQGDKETGNMPQDIKNTGSVELNVKKGIPPRTLLDGTIFVVWPLGLTP